MLFWYVFIGGIVVRCVEGFMQRVYILNGVGLQESINRVLPCVVMYRLEQVCACVSFG
jgi:hypothetical protein